MTDGKNKRLNKPNRKGIYHYVKDQIKFAEEKNPSHTIALSIASNMEASILERKYYECYESDVPEIKSILRDLKNACENHLGRVQKMLNETK